MNVTIVDYNSGNISSVINSFKEVAKDKINIKVTSDLNEIKSSDKVVLPGQGSFKSCVDALNSINGLVETLNEFAINDKKPIFMQKYKLSWRDLSFKDFKVYLLGLFKAFIPKKKIKNLDELETFIQTKSAWVTQVKLYSYLKTRMGTRYVLHFDDDVFMESLNLAKWNIYSVALQDLTFFTLSYLKVNYNYHNTDVAKEIYNKILDDEISDKMPLDIIEEARKTFNERFQNLKWEIYYNDLPFNPSALSLYKWAPIADELKSLDRKIVHNSMILKWDIIKKEFKDLIQF